MMLILTEAQYWDYVFHPESMMNGSVRGLFPLERFGKMSYTDRYE